MSSSILKQYLTYKSELFTTEETTKINLFLEKYNLVGTEVFMDDIISRDKSLFTSDEEKQELIKNLNKLAVKRIHCSYWAYPTSFLTKNNFNELLDRFGGESEVISYYGDLTGDHLYQRWIQEYELACDLGVQAYVFHAIDYAPIDGAWEFTISRNHILQAMASIVQNFLLRLEEKGLLTENSPIIEVENAGWGLEYGTQTSKDFQMMLNQLYDPKDKIRIGWDLNHLLHAIGYNSENNTAYFMLQDEEISPEMSELQKKYGTDPKAFAMKWIESNLLDSSIISKINSLHLSDCKLKDIEYFRNGRLQSQFAEEIDALQSWIEKENYGVEIVLSKYDCHLPLGQGILTADGIKSIIEELTKQNNKVVLLHELKNSNPIAQDLEEQLAFLK